MATYLVTGAGRGIGLEMTRQLSARGDMVIATTRRDAPGLSQLALAPGKPVRVERLDVADAASVDALRRRLEGVPVDVLVNNSGVGGAGGALPDVDADEMERVYRVNAVGPLRVLQALLPNLKAGKRKLVANVTSRMGSIEDNGSGGYYAYRASKAALNMVTRSLAVDLSPAGFTCVVLHPGWVRTDMGGPGAPLSVEQSVAGLLSVLDRVGPADSGKFFDHTGAPLPW
jgi:NAD(P)-dependent dehydrogenase (short-subunit alcohol dehydrogenase family)